MLDKIIMANHPEISSEKGPAFEEALEKLQLIVKKLESGELSLEDALKSFEDGVRLTRVCQEHLSTAEKRIEILSQGSTEGSIELRPFSPPSG